jgi:L-rhamnose mutarotase
MRKYYHNDADYEIWYEENKTGFIFNFFNGTKAQADMNKIHKANCRHLWRSTDIGRRTARYEKVCSSSLDEIESFVTKERGDSWEYCKTCKPELSR